MVTGSNPTIVVARFACRICGSTGPGSYIGDSCGGCREWADGQTTSVLISRVGRLLESRRQLPVEVAA